MHIKKQIFNHLKNLPGWRTKRKLVVISVDDYGNVRLDSKKARENMDKAGLKVHSRFDAYDTLETRDDLGALFEVLTSVKDKKGNHAVFTPFALPCNINFEAMQEEGYERYIYELLPETYAKLSALQPQAYKGTWDLWKEGIEKGLMAPQFHGREHFNLKVFESNLNLGDKSTLVALKNRSYTSINNSLHPRLSYTGAFDLEDLLGLKGYHAIVKDGTRRFNEVYGYYPDYFNPPGAREHSDLHEALHDCGIKYMDAPLIKKQIKEGGGYSYDMSYLGKKNKLGQRFLIRNVVFEPGFTGVETAVSIAWKQINAAFRLNKPAIISSHRVNFSGLITESNRTESLKALKILIEMITANYPEVEFISALELAKIITKDGR
ncbi:hypothetical protein [Salibacter halophilus]|uniref:Polysaccharide (De)acetylase n=1 Tax=Salibacter halophilus TaxID=1803916 RepID=A0A6N6M8W6_9FLAO|nr:hypothetical protein [Salibacter halophilus]KAB1063547.1 hypothetical protein F3059_10800 [Salibacter halophilus]